jgi:hypothetical protein
MAQGSDGKGTLRGVAAGIARFYGRGDYGERQGVMNGMVFEKKWSHFMYPVPEEELRDPVVKPNGRVETTFSDKMLLEGMRVATGMCQEVCLRNDALFFNRDWVLRKIRMILCEVERINSSQPTLSGEARDKLIRMALASAKSAGFVYIHCILEAPHLVNGHATTFFAIFGAEIPGEEAFVLKDQVGDEEIEWGDEEIEWVKSK